MFLRKKLPEASLPKPSKDQEEDPKKRSARQKAAIEVVDEFEVEAQEDEKKTKSQGTSGRKKK